jgi:hypothetical protein
MRFAWLAFVVSILLYAYIGEAMPRLAWFSFANAASVYIVLSVFNLYYFFQVRKRLYSPALKALQDEPDNIQAVRRWMGGGIVLISIAQCEALFGLALREDGKTLEQTLPFYLVGFLLTLWLWPRKVWLAT